MKKSDLLKKLENLKDDDQVNDMLKGTDIEEEFKNIALTLDNFKEQAKTDKDFKSYIDSMNDSYHAKALKTMKEKGTWENEFGDVLKTKFPNLITDPKEKEMLDLKKQLEDMKVEQSRQALLKDALKYAVEKKLPSNFVEKFLGEDLDTTKANLDGFATDWSKAIQSAVESKLKDTSYTPPGSGGDDKTSIGSSFAKQRNETNTQIDDPWSSK